MKKGFSVYASLLSATPDDADDVASWLADREAARRIAKMKVDETVQDAARLASEANAYDERIAVSQIRILSKRYTAEPDVVPFVAVIDRRDDETWLIVPFSPYKTPATPGEMATGLEAHGLHVLQTWNGRMVQEVLLRKSYLFGTLPDAVRTDALALFRHELGGVELPADFAARRGSPIVGAADPRREYLAECIARLQPLSDAVLAEAEKPAVSCRGRRREALWGKYGLERVAYAYAAATDELFPKVSVLMYKGAWDALQDGRLASQFCGYRVGDDPRWVIFTLCDPLPSAFDGRDVLPVTVYRRTTREQVGAGKLKRMPDGGSRVAVQFTADVAEVGEIVLVIEEEDGKSESV